MARLAGMEGQGRTPVVTNAIYGPSDEMLELVGRRVTENRTFNRSQPPKARDHGLIELDDRNEADCADGLIADLVNQARRGPATRARE